MRFDPDAFSRTSRRTVDEENLRLGLHYKSRPGHQFLFAVNRGQLKDEAQSDVLTVKADNDGTQYESQYLWQSTRWRGVAGLGYLESDDLTTVATTISLPFLPPIEVRLETEKDIKQSNAYLYNTFIFGNSTLLVGASYDDINQKNGVKQDQFNPKLGISWNIHPHVLLRLAAFRTLKLRYVQNQTLEPTQVVGFNQLFADQLGTDNWRYGLGMDYAASDKLKLGIELSTRDITRIITEEEGVSNREESQQEDLHRAYLYWNLGQHIALSTEYQYEDFERDFIPGRESLDRPAALTTQRLPLAVHFFYNNGLYARLQTTYVDQKITFVLSPSGTERLQDNFWIANAALGYRLPKRKGLVELIARNLTDENFRYQSVTPGPGVPVTSPFYPEAAFFMTIQLWL